MEYKKKLKKNDKELKNLQTDIEVLQNKRASNDNMERLKACRKEINEVKDKEEHFWRARSRIQWLIKEW